MTKAKFFRVDEVVAKDFEVLCKILGISERQAGELAIRDWTRKNRSQVSLETWTETRGAIASVSNAMIKIQLTIVKAELQQILETYKAINPEYRLETLHKLQKLIPTAQALVEETDDKELREIVASIATQVAKSCRIDQVGC
jgi:hypothetical protein